jgi:hypothetical protein
MAPWKKIGLNTHQLEDALGKILTYEYEVVSADNLVKSMKTTTFPKAIICNIDPASMKGNHSLSNNPKHLT